MFKSKKTEESFLKACNTEYEDLMDPHFFSCKTPQDFELCHQRTKAQILAQLPEKWKASMGSKKMSSKLHMKVLEAIDAAFEQLKGHFEFSKGAGSTLDPEEQALQLYTDEMEKYMKNHADPSISGVKEMYSKYSASALKYFETSANFDSANLPGLNLKVEQAFANFLKQAQLNENSKKDPAIGIDLGTTMCCVMVYYGGKVKVVPNWAQANANTTPSFVSYLDDGSDTFGFVAKDQAFKSPETTIYDAKRMIGRKWNDQELQNDRKHWPFEVVEEKGHPMIKTWGQTRHPHEVSARLLAQFRVMAEEFLNLPVGSITKAVITVPAYFTEPQRRATCEAANIAGLDVLNILSEPTAAAIAYSWERRDKKENRISLIYDLGGGTFDVSIASVRPDKVEILAVDGDTHLGGQDIDQLLMDYCIEEFKKSEGVDLLKDKSSPEKTKRDQVRSMLSRLKGQCEKAKVSLSSAKKTTVDVERIYGDKHLGVTVTQEKLEEMVTPIMKKTTDILDRILEEVKTKKIRSKADIDDVILVGGTTRMPLVEKVLTKYFGGKQMCKSINPDEAVAYGAAIQAFNLNNKDVPKPIQVLDVTPMTLGIAVLGDKLSVIIPKNTAIPCTKSLVHTTVYDNQTEANIITYQGENSTASENKYLGEFVIGGLAKKPAGREEIDVLMKIDGNGMLHVEAKSLSTGSSKGITVTSDRLSIDKKDMEKMRKQIQKLALSHRNQ